MYTQRCNTVLSVKHNSFSPCGHTPGTSASHSVSPLLSATTQNYPQGATNHLNGSPKEHGKHSTLVPSPHDRSYGLPISKRRRTSNLGHVNIQHVGEKGINRIENPFHKFYAKFLSTIGLVYRKICIGIRHRLPKDPPLYFCAACNDFNATPIFSHCLGKYFSLANNFPIFLLLLSSSDVQPGVVAGTCQKKKTRDVPNNPPILYSELAMTDEVPHITVQWGLTH